MEPEDYRERRLRGEIPDAVEVDVRLTHAVEKVFERLCSPPPVQYLDKLYGELEKLGGFIANPKNIDSPFINSCFLMKYGIDRNSPDEIRRQQSEKAYKELYARFETMVGLKSPNKKDDAIIARNAGSQPVRTGRPEKSASLSVRSQRDARWDFERFSKTRTTSLKRQDMKNRQLYRLAACLIGAASLLLQSCSESRFKDCDRLCGSWSSVEASPMSLYIRKGTPTR